MTGSGSVTSAVAVTTAGVVSRASRVVDATGNEETLVGAASSCSLALESHTSFGGCAGISADEGASGTDGGSASLLSSPFGSSLSA